MIADVIVVGAGPAGTSTAISLAWRGRDVLLLDRAHFPRAKPCAEYLSPQASRVLHDLGVLETVERSGAAQLSGMAIRAPDGTCMLGEFAGCAVAGFRDRGLSVRREVLDTILVERARAAGARVIEGARVTDVLRDAAGTVCGVQFSRGSVHATARARLVVGADGLRSIVARRLGLARRARWPHRIALVTHYESVAEIGACGEMHVERDGYVGVADVGGGVTTVALVVPAARGREIGGSDMRRAAFLEQWLAARPQLAQRFAQARRVSPVRATGPFAARATRSWAPGVALVGDAADFFDPFTGEGIYAGLRGGELVARFGDEMLGATSAQECLQALRRYEKARRSEFGGKWLVERLIAAVVASPRLMNRAARVLATRKDMADLLVGVTGDFVPASAVLNARYLFDLFVAPAPRPATER